MPSAPKKKLGFTLLLVPTFSFNGFPNYSSICKSPFRTPPKPKIVPSEAVVVLEATMSDVEADPGLRIKLCMNTCQEMVGATKKHYDNICWC